jgi:hypothetical protein
VSVLVGSTERMGVGTNVQRRAVALHHLDCPWRPADLAQREGRIPRQGNANEEVQILRYVTEGSFDAYSWQTVTRKAAFISQVMRGRLDVRELEDVGEAVLSYNEVKALATGNPLLLEQASAQAEVTRLERLQRSHGRNQESLARTVQDTASRIGLLQERIEEADEALTRVGGTPPKAFRMTVRGRDYDKPGAANEALRLVAGEELKGYALHDHVEDVGEHHGFAITCECRRETRAVTLGLRGAPGSELVVSDAEVASVAIATRLANRLQCLPVLRETAKVDIERLKAERARAEQEIGKPFRHEEQLVAAREHLRDVEEQIARYAQPPPEPAPPMPTPRDWRGTFSEAVLESQRTATGDVAFVSATWQEQARIRISSPAELLQTAAAVGDGDAREQGIYGVRHDGAIHNTITGQDEYLRVDTDTATYPDSLRSALVRHFEKDEPSSTPPTVVPRQREPEIEVS